ncbi:hypothetical protein [Kineococcus aurantiacus]|uniref:Uncharacterized protein n=1 Tax=Kineococcus aurantiacus TaxID=37633 RepID=A0A7Y9DMU9_9ACTN|nr:hypothetical protein [Kineococcus aurantiacus]NYD23386.1 hypothetical protein [Kineococcus aurantiacus]
MSRRRGPVALAACAVACAVAFAVGGCGAPSFEGAVPALSQPQTEQDRLPARASGARAEAVDPGSTRYLGGTQVAEYWVGLDGEEICLVQSLRGTGTVGSSCAGADVFERSGVRVSTSSADVSATGLLVPEGFDAADATGDAAGDEEWVAVNDNLLAPADEGGSPASSG